MNRAIGIAMLVVFSACATHGMRFEPKEGAPKLDARPNNCHVALVELGSSDELPHEYRVLGTLVWELSAADVRRLGPDGIEARIMEGACAHGLFVVSDIKAYPRATEGGATYEARAGVYLDNEGNPLTAADPD